MPTSNILSREALPHFRFHSSVARYHLPLVEGEVIDRERRAAERRIKEAAFPVIKTIESFDFPVQPPINEPLVRELLRGEYSAVRVLKHGL